ncbi:molybdenum cofactor biosynthesis protein [Campylobacter sp. MIT 12-8780]|uniref:molybdenum cofactor biosynthesis protein n=1 Tax=unclassified Campylobacter TaxID=2593542 RepID=UPI0010FA54BD|nr:MULTISPECIES: molybdenum cofactor biosynthesis protein [unclassified Campylobacter]NDJ26997.1 molybdenum cofactor biosynthesis protein [Campylobacter sp. MIT 19-121]TKX29045.1 molybdenum cofactor biosynthesis protein [Campylobacter sp. MIT 12-5580]TQR41864.1 molybdenum cofactor biosynthesis protein [Campylobacter sp. MIT 12-8780]
MFFKKKIPPKTSMKKEQISDYMLDDRLYDFTQNIRQIAKDKDKAALLARQFTRLIKADKGL